MAKLPSKLFSSKFRNWLLYLVVSRQNLKSIAGYTLQALRQDGERFQAQLDRLQPLYDGFDTGLTIQAGASAGRGSQTLQADTVFDLIKLFMRRAYRKHFAALEEDNPALFKEFFPAGRSEYSGASRQGMGTTFPRFVATLGERQAEVPDGAALLAAAQPLAEQYARAREAQDARKKQVKSASADLNADETDLLVELFGAYAALLAFYYKTPERVETYFDFSLLPHPPRPDADATPAPAPGPAGA
ncbi:hypothetical protein [Hymenobacter sp.]|uniref:hypothetical protein n=1 Tax=Hymenobacter sp. TaxID=1898978 RepID=UPI00286AA671|nr:hypothetical protein [Hymenobacter sp.]